MPVAVNVGEGVGESGAGNAELGRGAHDPAQAIGLLIDQAAEFRSQQQVLQAGLGLERGANGIKELRSNDAAALPDARRFSKIQAVMVFI